MTNKQHFQKGLGVSYHANCERVAIAVRESAWQLPAAGPISNLAGLAGFCWYAQWSLNGRFARLNGQFWGFARKFVHTKQKDVSIATSDS